MLNVLVFGVVFYLVLSVCMCVSVEDYIVIVDYFLRIDSRSEVNVSNIMDVFIAFQFGSVAQSCPTLCDPMNHSTPGLPVHHQFPEFTHTLVH